MIVSIPDLCTYLLSSILHLCRPLKGRSRLKISFFSHFIQERKEEWDCLCSFGRGHYEEHFFEIILQKCKKDAQESPKTLTRTANVFSMKYPCTTIYMYIMLFVLYSVCTDPGKCVLVVNLFNRGPYGQPLRSNQIQDMPLLIHAC